MRDKGEPRAAIHAFLQIGYDMTAGALDQSALGFGRLPLTQHDDRLPGDAVKAKQDD